MQFLKWQTKLYVPVVTLSTKDDNNFLEQLKSEFKRTIKWNTKVSTQTQKQYLHWLIDPSFQGLNRLFVLSFEDNAHQASYKQYFFLTVVKDYNVVINGKNIFLINQ